jgi:proteasome assembly chaperone (PAC2) family protein
MTAPNEDGLVLEDRPALRQPFLVAAFEGWNDAADAATTAATWLIAQFPASRIAWIDPEVHLDFQARRPSVALVQGVVTEIAWPTNEFLALRVEQGPRDLVVLRGVEPNLHWHSFCRAVLEVARVVEAEMVVTLGALLADVPHTRPVTITGAATDATLAAQLGLSRSRYEGPTGIVGVLHDTCRREGVASASLWAPIPHYVATPPNPVATRALLDRFGGLSGLALELDDLDELGAAWRTRVDEIVAEDDDVRSYVQKLEARADAGADDDGTDEIPSGDDLAQELEQFLREQDE